MIKDIVVNLPIGRPRDVVSGFAVSVAELFTAHLTAIAFAYEPAVAAVGYDGITPAILDDWRAEQQAEAERAQKSFDDEARSRDIAADSLIYPEGLGSCAGTFSEIARNYDLSILGQATPEDDIPESLVIEAALFDSGRPILLVPYIQRTGVKLDRVMVCWDNSRNAARAVGDAMPFLKRARHVDVVTIEKKEQLEELRGAQIAEHLARHKLKVDLKPIVAPDSDAANIILSHAADSDTNLIVMGGYGHTRLREFILGGATRGILEAMTVPVFMSH
jgi:nucleotide-binding universal stress UspA family protein